MHYTSKIRVIFLFLLAIGASINTSVFAQLTVRGVAILEIPSDNGEPDPAKTHSVRHMVQVAGVPYIATQDIEEATEFAVLIATEGFDGQNLSDKERDRISEYVQNGGILISTNFKDPALFNLVGITDESFSTDRFSINFDATKSETLFKWFDEPEEKTIFIGNEENGRAIFSRSYTTQQAEVLATFDDGTPAIIRNTFGEGFSYTFGNSFKDLILRSQLNFDFTANRTYSNGFEPASDVFSLLLRGILIEHIPNLVWKNTSAFNSRATLILTHDVDAKSGMQWMNRYADFENSLGISATYFVTTHYIDDALNSDYYTEFRNAIGLLHEQNHEVASHSVGHFPDFDLLPFGTLGENISSYQPFHENGLTNDATVLGELEVSKKLLEEDSGQTVQAYRSGHLLFHDLLNAALDTLGYKFNSTNSANDVLTSFPYIAFKERSFSSSESEILEIPVTITDVVDEEFTIDNYLEMTELWLRVTKKYYSNGSPTVLLVHPNRDLKLRALRAYLDNLPEDISIQSLQAFGNFWLQRNDFSFSSSLENNILKVHLKNHQFLPDSLSLNVFNGTELEGIEVLGSDGRQISVLQQINSDGSILLHARENVITPPGSIAGDEAVRLFQNYPNPFNNKTTIKYQLKDASDVRMDLFTITGQKMETLVNDYQQAGPHWVEFDAKNYSSGLYVCRVTTPSNSVIKLMTLIK